MKISPLLNIRYPIFEYLIFSNLKHSFPIYYNIIIAKQEETYNFYEKSFNFSSFS